MSKQIVVQGGVTLQGQVEVAGAKNSALPLLVATLLTGEKCVLHNVPRLADIQALLLLLESLGASWSFEGHSVEVQTPEILRADAPYALVRSLRASFWILGPLLARHGRARVTLPGGDAIGTRPVDLHLSGLAKMGARITVNHGVVDGYAPASGLRPAEICLDYPSVGATHHLLMAASLIDGTSVIENAAREPEVVELAHFLSLLGAEVNGAGTSRIEVKGTRQPKAAEIAVLGDRIEAATYLIAGAVTGGNVVVRGVSQSAVENTLVVLEMAGCRIERSSEQILLRSSLPLKAISVSTAPFPGLATDVQPFILAALTKAQGTSTVCETVFDSRFGHVEQYRRFGADISVAGSTAIVRGVPVLRGAKVEGGDIRAAVGLVLMGLMSEGQTIISNVHHIERGYEGLDSKLARLGALIELKDEYGSAEVVVGC